jgi:uncharacterized protein (DUF3820 family)
MKSYILKFGKHKGQNFFDTPVSYQEWLLKQDWFKQAADIMKIVSDFEEEQAKEDKAKAQANQDKIDYVLKNASSIIGRNIDAYGWQYNNSGLMIGKISKIEFSEMQTDFIVNSIRFNKIDFNVFIDQDFENTSSTITPKITNFTFNHHQMYTLLTHGKLPKANRLFHVGVEAELI